MLAPMSEQKPIPRPAELVENIRRQQLEWVRAILAHNHWNPTRLARESGMSQSTLSKFLNDPSNMARLETNSVEKLKRVSPFPPYETRVPVVPRGVTRHEAEALRSPLADPHVAAAVEAVTAAGHHITAWVLQSRALEVAGYLPGDVLLVETGAQPDDGDAVCAEILDRAGNAETVFRIYEAPYLQAATYARGLFKPLLIDGDRVVLQGVVIASVRPRLSLLAS